MQPLSRRSLLSSLVLTLRAAEPGARRPLRGIFPIAQTPFGKDGALDVDTLVRQLEFLDRGGVHGCVWPQLASEWNTLTPEERFRGAEALVTAGRRRKPAIVIGVQGPDAASAVRHAEHAAKLGADAVIALPPPGRPGPEAVLDYYRRIGQATPLPLFVQAIGDMNVETVLRMWREVPTLKLIKDEAGEPLMRIAALRTGSKDDLKVFTGAHGRTLIDEMYRGSAGTMPAASFADLYATVWDLWESGKRKEAMEHFGRVLLLITEVQVYGIASLKYILERRGVFKNHTLRRSTAPSGLQERAELDAKGREVLDQMLDYARPYLRA